MKRSLIVTVMLSAAMVYGQAANPGLLAWLGTQAAGWSAPTNPVAYWAMTNPVQDDTTGNYAGVPYGNAKLTNGVDDTTNSAWYFDGVHDGINIVDNNVFSFGNGSTDSAFSYSFWIYVQSYPAEWGSMVSKWTNYREYGIWMNNNGRFIFILADNSKGDNANSHLYTSNTIPLKTWTHIVATYDGTGGATCLTGANLYINGVYAPSSYNYAAQAYVAMENTTSVLTLGSNGYWDLNCALSRIRLYARELTQAEAATLSEEFD